MADLVAALRPLRSTARRAARPGRRRQLRRRGAERAALRLHHPPPTRLSACGGSKQPVAGIVAGGYGAGCLGWGVVVDQGGQPTAVVALFSLRPSRWFAGAERRTRRTSAGIGRICTNVTLSRDVSSSCESASLCESCAKGQITCVREGTPKGASQSSKNYLMQPSLSALCGPSLSTNHFRNPQGGRYAKVARTSEAPEITPSLACFR